MSSPINIEALKSTNISAPGEERDTIIDPNVGKNIDGRSTRDFGNGLMEFDPAANGFVAEKVDPGESDDEKALKQLDNVLQEKAKEVEIFNELQEMNNGVVSEEELREALDQGYITKDLHDGHGDRFEDNPKQKAPEIKSAPQNTITKETNTITETDMLEKELEVDDDTEDDYTPSISVPESQKNEPQYTTSNIEVKNTINQNASNPISAVSFEDRKISSVDDNGISQEDRDLEALEGNTTIVEDTDFENKLKAELQKKIRPVTKKFDLASAQVIKKPASINNYLARRQKATKRSFVWPLFRSGRPVQIQSFNATELNILNDQARNVNTTLEVFRTIYEHIVGFKGADFNQWCKCTSYFDTNHLWFAIYGACFYNANYLPFTCDHCNEITVTTNTPLMDMVKFKNDDAKAKFDEIMAMPQSESMGSVFVEHRVQIADDLVVGFVEPSIYTSVVEGSYYDKEFRNKYSDIINIISYISDIYYVTENGQLEKFKYKEFENNAIKTAKARVIQYAKLIRSLTSDEYAIIMSAIIEMSRDTDIVSYQMPEITCEKCGHVIPAEDQDASSLVFTRHQLVMFGA